ncbi:glycine--tRNA ligase [Cryobacterium sp. TMT1-3]|uniref:Glycine--tRNA ligase n=1 Tax=Cryobacterium luteum TaxID=1424661 RepID=A0A1H8B1I6_9MICO|nr:MULTISPECIES: glycine--tRNA ligase [Cryobacterium]TFB88706.1 glycine--tRNA ligase [Cryobacterium luteum]TFC24710.1 glycine--tRNA ligase [Cryobacterium sp. TMT1-3]SEM76770.1 glycyl-tRNA synthetase [Cryobacterium luteum]
MAAPTHLDSVIALARHRGFVFQAGEIYGGSRSAWDYGPLGVELKENIKKQWWRSMVTSRDDVVGLDSSVILPRQVWEASGHVEVFSDPLIECTSCHKRFRADHLEEQYEEKKGRPPENGLDDIPCPNCGNRHIWTEPRAFSGLLKTYLGPVDDEAGMHYLRPETAQGIFVNFANVLQASRSKPPFGIGQIGKSFRNEITPGNFIFRTREFEQMEMEFFVEPGTDETWHQYWIDTRMKWYTDLGINPENLRLFEHPAEKLSHYSKRTVDIEYRFGFTGTEFGELEGVANRGDFDLSTHAKASGKDLSYFDQTKNERWTPWVIEPAAGLTRSLMAFLVDAYVEEEVPNAKGGVDKRTVLKLDPRLSPVKAAILPLSRNEKLSPMARELAATLRQLWNVDFDDAGAIGRRYRRQDEIGTPFCITVDFDSLDDQAVTVRDRDTMAQERVPLAELEAYLAVRLRGA